MHKVFPRFRLQREHNRRRQLCSPSHVLCLDCYLKRNICLSEAVRFCRTRLWHPAPKAIHLVHSTHTHVHTKSKQRHELIANTHQNLKKHKEMYVSFSLMRRQKTTGGAAHKAITQPFSEELKVFPLDGRCVVCSCTMNNQTYLGCKPLRGARNQK